MTTMLCAVAYDRRPVTKVLVCDKWHRPVLSTWLPSSTAAHIVGNKKVAYVIFRHLRVLVATIACLLISLLAIAVVSRTIVFHLSLLLILLRDLKLCWLHL